MPSTPDSRVYEELRGLFPNARRILAEGDSWLAHPRQFIVAGARANLVDALGEHDDLLIYSTAANGDEAACMLCGEQKLSLIKRLHHNHFDALLFSGGGNDLLGRYDFPFLLRDQRPGMGWRECVIDERVAIKREQLRATYRYLCAIVGEYSRNPDIRIITHTYDYAIPRRRGFRLFDLIPLGESWMYPVFRRHGIRAADDQQAIVRHLLGELRRMLDEVAAEFPRLTVVDTQGTLTPADWRDEIHPNARGFRRLARKLYPAIA